MVFSLFVVHWVMPRVVVELLDSWQGKFSRCSNASIWSTIPRCLMCLAGVEYLKF